MNSLEWRVKKLENILGYPAFEQRHSICDRLIKVANAYQVFNQIDGDKYARFQELNSKLKNWEKTNDVSATTKAEIILGYYDDLTQHLESLKAVNEKAEKVLDVQKWPDMSGYQKRLSQLEKITKEQHLESMAIDKKTEELIELYNEIISSFKANMIIWDQKLEDLENEEKRLDEDD